jgi:hypothetical protein
MAQVEIEVDAQSSTRGTGVLTPTAGGSATIIPNAESRLNVAVDYSSSERLVLTVAGNFNVLHDKLDVSGSIATNLFDGKTAVTGSLTYTIDKSVSAELSTTVSGPGFKAGAGVTIRF